MKFATMFSKKVKQIQASAKKVMHPNATGKTTATKISHINPTMAKTPQTASGKKLSFFEKGPLSYPARFLSWLKGMFSKLWNLPYYAGKIILLALAVFVIWHYVL
jgi:hypothetical protein